MDFIKRNCLLLKQLSCLILMTFLIAGAAMAQSQANAADLSGTVTDQNGAIVPNATVTATISSINLSRTATTNENGEYKFINLPPGEYQITAEAANFKKSVLPSVRLTVGQTGELNIKLEVGQQTVSVTVDSSNSEVVETTRTAVSTTIDQQKIENLPINQRDYLGFTLTSSSVGRDNGRPIGPAPTSGVNIGGQRGRSSLVQVDGADNTDNSINSARSTVSQEAVQEFQVVTNSFAPEFGRSAGGIVNVVTKRGTNDFHGNVFGFLRDKSIQARNAFAPINKPAFRRTQYGATLGGPLAKDHTFFFAAFEGRRRDESGFFTQDVTRNLTGSVTIPVIAVPGLTLNPNATTFTRLTPQQVTAINNAVTQGIGLLGNATTLNQGIGLICSARAYGYFASSGGQTGLTGTNNLASSNDGSACNSAPIGSPITPILPGIVGSRFFLSGAPVPIGTQDASGNPIAFRALNNLQRIFPVTDRTNFSSVRFDQIIDQRNQLNLRVSYNTTKVTGIQVESQNQSLGQNDFSRTGTTDFKDSAVQSNLISTYGNAVNEGKFAFSRRKAKFFSQVNDAVAYNIADTAYIGRELFSPVDRIETRFQLADNFTYVTGNHTLKVGADFNWVNIPSALFELDFSGLFNFGETPASQLGLAGYPNLTAVQSYGLGFPSNFIQGFGNSRSKIKNKPIAFFGQDSWKILHNVTFNYGLRYDVELTDTIAPTAYTDPLSGISLSQNDVLAAQNAINVQQGLPRDKNNFAPRVAAAWDVFGTGRTVVRAAGGLFYDHPLLTVAFNSDITDSTQQQQGILTAGSPSPTALLNAAQVFQGTVCGSGANPVCPAGVRTPGVATTAIYQFGRQRFDPTQFYGYTSVLPFSLPVSRDFKYASAVQANLTVEHQLNRNMSVSASYLFVHATNLPHPTDINQPRTDLQIENFRRLSGRNPSDQTEAVGFSIPSAGNIACPSGVPLQCFTVTTPAGNPFPYLTAGQIYAIIVPGMIAAPVTNLSNRVINPAIANFFRPNAPNYFLASALTGGAVSKAVLDSQLTGTLRTPGLLTPFGATDSQVSDGNSTYNALTIDVKRRLANNFQFLASYTLSKSIDDSSDLQTLLIAQDSNNFQLERSVSLFDQRHRFVFSGVLQSPTDWRGKGGFKSFLADFTVAPIIEVSSGRPFNVITNVDSNNDQSNSTDRPSVNADGTLGLPSLFTTDKNGRTIFAFGNLGRNRGVTHPFSSVDLRLSRAIRFGERIRLDLIGEGFNLLNRFNEASASPNYVSVNAFGKRAGNGSFFSIPTAAYDARQFQFAVKLNF